MRGLLFPMVLLMPILTSVAGDKPEFAPNQEWSYHARPQDAGSTIVIGLIQDDPKLGRIIHITVRAVNIRNSRVPGGVMTQIGHLPMSETALAASVTELKGIVAPSESVPVGVKEWERAKGGAFTFSVAQTVDYVEQVLGGTWQRDN